MDEVIKRVEARVADHRAHLAKLETSYGGGEWNIDERGVGIVLNFGDLLDLLDRIKDQSHDD